MASKTPLRIQGSGSKAFLGRAVEGQLLDVRAHRGIVSYDPTELVVTVRAGTPLTELEAALIKPGRCCPASRRTSARAPPSAA
ncbi:Glycolate oxidase subunit GlcE OS=Stutzerimonas stutzeri OX=316 GN=CXK94_00950 PE=4 SV=1 [Stutzerimonas stutzeri]